MGPTSQIQFVGEEGLQVAWDVSSGGMFDSAPLFVGGRQDFVNYDDDGVNWPADNNSASIYLPDSRADNNVGANWSRSVSGIDGAVNPSGAPFDTADVGSPGFVAGLDFTPQ